MESKTNYTIVGLAVLILAAGLIAAALWLSVGFNQKTYSFYTLYLHESASGLSEDAPVKFNGVKVGFVKKIELNKKDPRQVKILLSIEKGTPVTRSTKATLVSQGITGVAFIGLSADSSELAPIKKLPGERYPVIPAKPSLFNQLDSILRDVSGNLNKVSAQVYHIFNEENATYIKNSLANVEQLTQVFAQKSMQIDNSLKNMDITLKNLAQVSKDFPKLLKELRVGVTKFSAASENISDAGKYVSQTMVAGKTTLDKISQQTLPPAVLLLQKLNIIAANLEKMSNEVRQNPSVIIRGTTTPKPGPGE